MIAGGSSLLPQFAIGVVSLYTLVTAARLANDGALSLARYYDIPDELIGMTVIAIGTSLPEISANLVASIGIASGTLDYDIASAVVLGGNLGSATTQQTLLVGVFIVGFGTLQVSESLVTRSYLPMLAAFLLTFLVAFDGTITRVEGLVLVAGFAGYTYYGFRHRRQAYAVPERPSTDVRRDLVYTLGGLVLVLLAAVLLLSVAETIVSNLALGGSMIGVLTLGLAAALPELSTVLDAVRRRAPNIALGTLIGSNVVNPLLGIGLGASVSGYAVPRAIVVWDLPFKIVVGVAGLAYLWVRADRTVSRRDGVYLLVAYFVFVSGRLLLFPAQ